MTIKQQGRVLAVDLGGSKLEVGLVTSDGEILCTSRCELSGTPYTRNALLDKISVGVQDLIKQYGELGAEAVGVSIPGPCDPINGVFLRNFTNEISNWPIADDLTQLFSLPVFGDNDVNACALAEKAFGICKNCSDYMWVTLSFGCGGAFFLNNMLYRGSTNLAGEVGHIPVKFDYPSRCKCGVYGDMEVEGSGTAIGRKYLEQTGHPPNATFFSKDVSRLARKGDKKAIALFFESGYCLGRICAMAINMLNLPKIVLGGGVVVYDYDLLKPGLDQALNELVFPPVKGSFSVDVTALGYHASLLGAAALALSHA